MKITVCDDEPLCAAQISKYARDFLEKNGLDIQVAEFNDPAALLGCEETQGPSQIYLLDVIMDGLSGLELGKRIRAYAPDAAILYLTSSREFALDAYDVHPSAYLLKPVQPQRLEEELARCLTQLLPPKRPAPIIAVKTADGLIPIPLHSVDAVEYCNHRLVYHLSDGVLTERVSARESFDLQAQEFMGLGSFVKTSSSYYVNLDNVHSISPRGFRMKSGEEYPITQKYIAVKEAFLRHKFGGDPV